ncbi:MAG: hypothetical protein AB7U83_14110 [Vicinamibacterales bacterium]
MRELTCRPQTDRLDAAAFDAMLDRVAERVVVAPADESAGARVVARLRAPRPGSPGHLAWVPVGVAAALAVAMWWPVREPAEAVPASPARVAVAAAADDRAAAAPGPAAPAAPQRLAAPPTGAPAGRRRARSRAPSAPVADDDPSTVPLLVVMGALRLGGTDGAADPLAPAPLPVDALALESLDPAPLDPWQD